MQQLGRRHVGPFLMGCCGFEVLLRYKSLCCHRLANGGRHNEVPENQHFVVSAERCCDLLSYEGSGKTIGLGGCHGLAERLIPATLSPTAAVMVAIWMHKHKPTLRVGTAASVLPAFTLATVICAQAVSDRLTSYGHAAQGTLVFVYLFCVAIAGLSGSLVHLALRVRTDRANARR